MISSMPKPSIICAQQKKLGKHISEFRLFTHQATTIPWQPFQFLLIDIPDMRISMMNTTTAMKEPISEPEMRPQK